MKIYIALPYTGIEELSFKTANDAMEVFVRMRHAVYSPISQSHAVAINNGLPGDWEFWKHQNLPFIPLCDLVVVITLPGWRESVGVTAEIEHAKKNGIRIDYVPPGWINEKKEAA